MDDLLLEFSPDILSLILLILVDCLLDQVIEPTRFPH